MKKVLSLVIAVLMVASLAATAFATASPTLQAPEVVGVTSYDKDGNVVELDASETVTVVANTAKEEADPEVVAALEEAVAALEEAGSVEAIIPEFADMTVSDVFNISASEGIAEVLAKGGTVTVTLDMKVEPGTELEVIVFKDGKWVKVELDGESAITVSENGDVNLTISELGIYAILVK